MSRKGLRQQILAAAERSLAGDESLQTCTAVWGVEVGGRMPLLLRGRRIHYLALTDQRLLLYRRPRRGAPLTSDQLVIAKRHSGFSVERVRRLRPMLQVVVRAPGERLIALEFRPRDRKVGRELAPLLRRAGTSASTGAPWGAPPA